MQQCVFKQNARGANFTKEGRTQTFRGIYKLCLEWTQSIPYDFREKQMQQRLVELLSLCSIDEHYKSHTDRLLQQLRHTGR